MRHGSRGVNRVIVGVVLVALGLLVGVGWYVLDGTFGKESPVGSRQPARDEPDRTPGFNPNLAGADIAGCQAESRIIREAIQMAGVLSNTGGMEGVRALLSEPEGEFFAVAEDGTVTTVVALPPGCPLP